MPSPSAILEPGTGPSMGMIVNKLIPLLLLIPVTGLAQNYQCPLFATDAEAGGHYWQLEGCTTNGVLVAPTTTIEFAYQVPQIGLQITAKSGDRDFTGTFNYSCDDGICTGITEPLVRIGASGNGYLFRTIVQCDAANRVQLTPNQFTPMTSVIGLQVTTD
jgi:hypothetical protein